MPTELDEIIAPGLRAVRTLAAEAFARGFVLGRGGSPAAAEAAVLALRGEISASAAAARAGMNERTMRRHLAAVRRAGGGR